MTSFVLVHGGAHGAWCWDRVVPLLRADPGVGAVVAVDLPGRGVRVHGKPLAEVTTEDFVASVVADIESRALRDVVLVGHSLAGITLAPAAARVAGRLRRVVYVSTTNPPVGATVDEMMLHPLSPLTRGVDLETMFTNDLDDETSRWLLSRLGPEAERPLSEPVEVATAPPGIPSTYVLLELDEALPPAYQREQAATAEVDEIITLSSGHSVFASEPAQLAALLLELAAR